MAAPRSKIGRAVWETSMALTKRATVTPASTSFIIITFVFCIALTLVHLFLYFNDATWNAVLSSALDAVEIPQTTYSYRDPAPTFQTLLLCHQVPAFAGDTAVADPCNISITIENSGDVGFVQHFPDISWQHFITTRDTGLDFQPAFDASGAPTDLVVSSRLQAQPDVTLSYQCVQTLHYAKEQISRNEHDDIALIVFQLWLLPVSVFAILHESVPHIWASLLSRFLVTGWSVYALIRTSLNMGLYSMLYRSTVSPCNIDVFDDYLSFRIGWVIAEVVCSLVSMIVLFVIGLRLSTLYHHQTFRHLGPPPGLIKVYWNFMAVQVCIQLGVYALATSAGLFLDQLINGPIAGYSNLRPLYLALCIGTLVFFVPYLLSGWYGIRRESKWLMGIFLACVSILIVCWCVVFYSEVFRLTFLDFTFFATIMCVAFLILILTLVFGGLSLRWFGMGLSSYLHAEDSLARAGLLPDVFQIQRKEGSIRSMSVASDSDGESFSSSPRRQRPVDCQTPTVPQPNTALPPLSALPSALLQSALVPRPELPHAHSKFMDEAARDPFARDAQMVDIEAIRRASMNVQRHSMSRSREGPTKETA